MRILMISAEGPPLQRAGALIDVMNALPNQLRKRGHEVSIALPLYREIRENAEFTKEETGISVDIHVGDKTYAAEYLEGRSATGIQLFFVRCDAFFDRRGVYGERGAAYEDNAARFIFFTKAVLELARRLIPAVQILHCHDWAAALVPVFVRAYRMPFATVLTIHHVEEQGSFWGFDFKLTNLHQRFFSLTGIEFFGRLNFLKGGILFADRVTTVSEHYKRDILTPGGGAGLDVVLRENADKLVSILNGADYQRWDPATDTFLPALYDPNSLWGKQLCRDALINHLRLDPGPQGPVLGMATRVVPEKGFSILVPVLDRLLSDDVRLIIIGEGDPAFETALAVAAKKFPTRFSYQRHYDEQLAHLIEAAIDISLIPSRFEPSGVQAMYSLKYAALPVARATGGIQEIVEDYDPTLDRGYGFFFYDYTSEALWDAIKRAREVFEDRQLWMTLCGRAMTRNFSWDVSAAQYEMVYRQLVAGEESTAA
jgi:starch synthase